MERKIGEIFRHKGEWYQCVEASYDEHSCLGCDGCWIEGGSCNAHDREDGKYIIFKKLEKVGKPYEYFVHGCGILMIQEYILYIPKYTCNAIYNLYIFDCLNGRVAIGLTQNQEDMEEKELTINNKINCLCERYNIPHNLRYGFISEMKELLNREECSNSESIGKNLKPFDLDAAKAGKPVCTRDGRKARIICLDAKDIEKPIIALYENDDDDGEIKEVVETYNNKGEICEGAKWAKDLMMLPEKHEGWVNVYKGGLLDTKSYNTRKEAFDKASPKDYVDTIKISWEE